MIIPQSVVAAATPERCSQELIEDIQTRIHGRLCYEEHNCNYLAWAVTLAGDGDHLEIGTLHGGSAILVALIKQRLGFKGTVYCVDPLNGYYVGTKFEHPVDWESKVPVSPEILKENLRTFGVHRRVHWLAAASNPWPDGLPAEFVSAYIDGDHWGLAPLQDWMNVKDKIGKYVVFDNANPETHPAVANAIDVARQDPDWEIILEAGITAILQRRH